MKAIVISSNSGNFIIQDVNDKFSNKTAKTTGNIKRNGLVVAGDLVEYDYDDSTYLINKVEPRTSYIIRPKIANISTLFIVQSVIEPDINISQVFKYDTFYRTQGINDIHIILTKTDMIDDKARKDIINNLKQNYLLSVFDANSETDVKEVLKLLNKGINCFVGQSGVGKSTFLNKVDKNLSLRTNEISKSLNRGKHTTTVTTLYNYGEGYIVDTPGFSSIELNITMHDLAYHFFNFNQYAPKCKFNDCCHENEKDCFVKQNIDGINITEQVYQEYLKLKQGLKK